MTGAALNSNLLNGGGTDDTAALQAVLDRAANGKPVHLVIDGVALVSGLSVYGNTTIECLPGAGLFLKDHTSRDLITNVHHSMGAIADEYISVRGCFLNGNRDHQRPPPGEKRLQKVEPNQEADGRLVTGVQFLGVKNVRLEHLTIWQVRTYGILIANAERISVRDIRVDNGSPRFDPSRSIEEQLKIYIDYLNTDGVDLYGPIHGAILDGLTLHTGDDALALNTGDEMSTYLGGGPITDVIATNVILDEATYGIRLLSTDQRIDRVTIQNVSGTLEHRSLVIDHYTVPAPTGNIGSVLISDVNLKLVPVPPPREFLASYRVPEADMARVEQQDFPLFALNASIENLSLQHVMVSASDSRPLIHAGPDAAIKRLSANFSVNDPELRAVPLRLERGARIERMNWALDWYGRELEIGKPPIVNHGGEVGQLHWLHTPPQYVKAQLDARDDHAILVSFTQAVKASDLQRGVTVSVNGAPVRILEAARQPSGDAVRFRVPRRLNRTSVVAWSYDESKGAIQNDDGDHMRSVSAQTVMN